MTSNGRSILRQYYDTAASNYLDRMSGGIGGWLRNREVALTHELIPTNGEGRKTLDAGCGPGLYSQLLRKRGYEVTAIDLSPEMVSVVKSLGFPAYEMDIEHSEPPKELSDPFDFILCAGVLEFANDVERFLASLRKMSTTGSELVVVAPLAGAFGRVYTNHLIKRGIPARAYTRKTLANALDAVGFEPIEVRAKWPICLAAKARAY